MQLAGIQVRRRFFVSIGLLTIGTGIWYFWSRSTLPSSPVPGASPEAFVKIVGMEEGAGGRTMEERAEYFDPTPLFLPTGRSYHQGELPARVVRQPGQVFTDFSPKLNFAETALPEYGLTGQDTAAGLGEVLNSGNSAPFAGFGQMDRMEASLPPRSGYIEAKALKNGNLSISEGLDSIELPADYPPVEFIVTVVAAGLAGDPVLHVSSGREEVDLALREFLIKHYRIGERLTPGRYAVTMGP